MKHRGHGRPYEAIRASYQAPIDPTTDTAGYYRHVFEALGEPFGRYQQARTPELPAELYDRYGAMVDSLVRIQDDLNYVKAHHSAYRDKLTSDLIGRRSEAALFCLITRSFLQGGDYFAAPAPEHTHDRTGTFGTDLLLYSRTRPDTEWWLQVKTHVQDNDIRYYQGRAIGLIGFHDILPSDCPAHSAIGALARELAATSTPDEDTVLSTIDQRLTGQLDHIAASRQPFNPSSGLAPRDLAQYAIEATKRAFSPPPQGLADSM